MISGRGRNLQALIDAQLDPSFPAEIKLVLSNVSSAEGLIRCENASIPTRVIRSEDFRNRHAFEDELHESLLAAGAQLVCLAGFMRILTKEFVISFTNCFF